MYDVKGNLHQVLDTLPQGTRLVAISKYHPAEYIMAAYDEGQRVFGESHEQELRLKHEQLPKDIKFFTNFVHIDNQSLNKKVKNFLKKLYKKFANQKICRNFAPGLRK